MSVWCPLACHANALPAELWPHREAAGVTRTRAFRQENERATAPRERSPRPKRAIDSALPRIVRVASIGGETVPPQTASRSGCARLPKVRAPVAAISLISAWIAGTDCGSTAPSRLSTSFRSGRTAGVTCFLHGLLVEGGWGPEKEHAHFSHLTDGLGSLALPERNLLELGLFGGDLDDLCLWRRQVSH